MPIELPTTTETGEKREKIQKNLQNKSNVRIIHVFLEWLLPGSFPSLGAAVHLASLGCPLTPC